MPMQLLGDAPRGGFDSRNAVLPQTRDRDSPIQGGSTLVGLSRSVLLNQHRSNGG